MSIFEKLTKPSTIKRINFFLERVCEPYFNKNYQEDVKFSLYGFLIKPKNSIYGGIPVEDLLYGQAKVTIFIDSNENAKYIEKELRQLFYDRAKNIVGFDVPMWPKMNEAVISIQLNQRSLEPLTYKVDETINEEIEPSDRAKKNICDSEKFCKAQGKITFGQLRSLVENAKVKKILTDVGEGSYKATLRLLPWFFPQLAIAGFTGSVIRAFNKVFRPALEDTTGYKTWWGKVIMKIFNLVEGDLGITDPLSKIFFISDGLMTMLDNKEKIKFARYIAEVASKKPDDEEVPEFFVENELRHWLNEKFLLDPPLQPKEVKGEQLNEGQYDFKDSEEYYEKIDKLLNKFLSATNKEKNIPNFLGYRALTGKNHYGDFTVKLTGIFEKSFSVEDADMIYTKKWELMRLIRKMFPFLNDATFYASSTSTLDNYERNLDFEKKYLNRNVKNGDEDDELPFLQEEKNGVKTRLFKEGIDDHELKWHFDELDRNVKVVKSNGWLLQMDNKLPVELKEGKTFFIPKGVYHRVLKGNGDLVVEIKEMKESLLVERNKNEYSEDIRKIVKDIIDTFKENDEGEFYLPEDINDDGLEYEIPKLGTSFSVELKIDIDNNIEAFKTNAAIWHDDNTISVVIVYNPENKKTILYDLVGDLNQNIAHELRHIHQSVNNMFDLDVPEEKDPYMYYTQPHELDAQLFGFKRLAKLSKKPLLDVIKNWFENNKDIHQLKDDQVRDVIIKILNHK